MKSLLNTSILLLLCLALQAQDEVLVEKKKLVDGLSSVFQVLKEKKSIKQGEFKSYYKSNSLAIQGQYTNNLPTGLWIFFNEKGDTVEIFNQDLQTSDLKKSHYDTNGKFYLNGELIQLDSVDVMPHYPGGYFKMTQYIKNNLRYPEFALENNIRGTILISFSILETGELKSYNIEHGIHLVLNNEAVRLIKSMPKWQAAVHKGKAVKYKYYLPILFS